MDALISLPFLSLLWGTNIATDISVIEFLETPAKGAKLQERGGSPQWLITKMQRNNEVNQGNTERRKVAGLVAFK